MERQQLLRHQLRIKAEKKTAELAALKAQLNPHFLFNTLNNIYSLAVQGSPMTAVSIEKLSGILDYLLYRCDEKFVPLNQEINLLNNYISLQKLRYSNRLLIDQEFSIDSDYSIAPLILLTMVENMFKHGVEKTTGKAILKIKINATKGKFCMLTENTFDPQSHTERGIGFKNVRHQLHLIYPTRHQIDSKEIGSIYRTQLKINLT
ncbi:sensor histidine kinase [Algoriphagus confluentis]|uniref:sensor histidine kinase n=1 Tax=Algoriphagus confluentis TaxID=1697556 RepID=UPI0030C67859